MTLWVFSLGGSAQGLSVFYYGHQAVGEIGHYAVGAGGDYAAHFVGVVHGPGGEEQIGAMGLFGELGRDESGAGTELARAHFESTADGVVLVRALFNEEAGHDGGVKFADAFDGAGVKRNDDGAGGVLLLLESAYESMVHAPGRVVFHFEIKDDVVLAAEFENVFERGNALAHELAVVPEAGVEAAKFGEGEVGHIAAAVGGSFQGAIVDSHKAGVPGEVQVGLDENDPEFDGAFKRGHRVLGSVSRSTSMGDDPRLSHRSAIVAEAIGRLFPSGADGCWDCNRRIWRSAYYY